MWLTSCSAIRAGWFEFSPPHARLTVDAHADLLISPSGRLKVGCPAAGSTQGERATPMDRSPAAAELVAATTSGIDAPPGRAPATLYNKAIPAIPRRRDSHPFVADATSSAARTVTILIPLVGEFAGEIKVHHVA